MKKFLLILGVISVVSFSVWASNPGFYPEGNTANSTDDSIRIEQKILGVLHDISQNGLTTTSSGGTTSTQRTPSITSVTSSGSVTAGSRRVTMIFSSDFSGTVLGVAYTGADLAQSFIPPSGDTLAAITYTRSAGSIRIVDIR